MYKNENLVKSRNDELIEEAIKHNVHLTWNGFPISVDDLVRFSHISRDQHGNVVLHKMKPVLQGTYWIIEEDDDDDLRTLVGELVAHPSTPVMVPVSLLMSNERLDIEITNKIGLIKAFFRMFK